MVTTIRQQETGVETLARLAQKARSQGVHVLHNAKTGQYIATSGTTAGTRYTVTPHSCTCRGHHRYGYCKHVAALMASLGWIEGSPAPTPEPQPITGQLQNADINWQSALLFILGRLVGAMLGGQLAGRIDEVKLSRDLASW